MFPKTTTVSHRSVAVHLTGCFSVLSDNELVNKLSIIKSINFNIHFSTNRQYKNHFDTLHRFS